MSYEKLQELQKLLKKLKPSRGICLLKGCGQSAIASHTLSHKRILKILEETDDKNQLTVLHLEDKIHLDFKNKKVTKYHEAERKLVKKGTNEASVFYGLCQPHDSELFDRLDKEVYFNNTQINFFHAYRAFNLYVDQASFCFQILEKEIEPNFRKLPIEIDKLEAELKKIEPFLKVLPDEYLVQYNEIKPVLENFNSFIKNQIIDLPDKSVIQLNNYIGLFLNKESYPMKGISFKKYILKLNDFLSGKLKISDELFNELNEDVQLRAHENSQITNWFENARLNKSYDDMCYLHRSISGVFGLAANFVFNHHKIGLVSLTILPEKETTKTHILLSTYENANVYFGQLNLMDKLTFEKYITTIIINQGTNVFFSHSFWNQIQFGISNTILSGKKVRAMANLNLFE